MTSCYQAHILSFPLPICISLFLRMPYALQIPWTSYQAWQSSAAHCDLGMICQYFTLTFPVSFIGIPLINHIQIIWYWLFKEPRRFKLTNKWNHFYDAWQVWFWYFNRFRIDFTLSAFPFSENDLRNVKYISPYFQPAVVSCVQEQSSASPWFSSSSCSSRSTSSSSSSSCIVWPAVDDRRIPTGKWPVKDWNVCRISWCCPSCSDSPGRLAFSPPSTRQPTRCSLYFAYSIPCKDSSCSSCSACDKKKWDLPGALGSQGSPCVRCTPVNAAVLSRWRGTPSIKHTGVGGIWTSVRGILAGSVPLARYISRHL